MNRVFMVCAFATLVVLVNAPEQRADELDKDQSLYCEMVQTFKDTNGQYGWPDYRGNAAKVCK
ncbi:hypothetical protein [Pseudomonas phage PPpW-3]|uniref:Uncharacterized protein n=1 Tax=Pseudomonas phage PPpW-3 TaxID=1279082 RepID=V5YTQ2_9CAUD|nr:hypothetical protein X916_gp44 [Pseudomonas phage PPpW-3]BAO20644.1 hypothetical protein [Pseudomonas phage PPpW-3]